MTPITKDNEPRLDGHFQREEADERRNMSDEDQMEPVSAKASPKFGSGFHYTVAGAILVLMGLGSVYPTDQPFLCGVAFVFSLSGRVMARSAVERYSGMVMMGVFGGFIAAYLRCRYFLS